VFSSPQEKAAGKPEATGDLGEAAAHLEELIREFVREYST
jgi:hypothetical protein